MACLLQSAWKKIRYFLETKAGKELALFTAGAIASVFWGLIVQIWVLNTQPVTSKILGTVIVTLGIVVILIVYGLDLKIIRSVSKWRRKTAPKVGILNDMEWKLKDREEISTNTDVSPEDWKKEIEELARNKIHVDLINAENNFDRYNVVINPYGGVYPEYDLNNLKTMNKILTYISEGGLFVNVADIPGFFACNPSIKPWRRVVTAQKDAPYVYSVQQNKLITPVIQLPLLHLTPFTRKLGIDIYTTEDTEDLKKGPWDFELGDLKIKVHRAALVGGFLDPKIKPQPRNLGFLFTRERKTLVTPIFSVKYGDGKLLSSLIFEKEQDERFRKVLRKMLAKLVIEFIVIDIIQRRIKNIPKELSIRIYL